MADNLQPTAPMTVKQFRKAHPELKGLKVILCEHLRNKSIDCVDYNLFIGDHTRVLLCPICFKIVRSDTLVYTLKASLIILDAGRKLEYEEWLSKA